MAGRGQQNKRCCKPQISTSLLNCGNPNAYCRKVKFAVRRTNTIQQKNRSFAAFLFKFCLHCNWCSCLNDTFLRIFWVWKQKISIQFYSNFSAGNMAKRDYQLLKGQRLLLRIKRSAPPPKKKKQIKKKTTKI